MDPKRQPLTGPELRYCVENVFLPPKLPQEEDEKRHLRDAILIETVSQSVQAFLETLTQGNEPPSKEAASAWKVINRMLPIFCELHVSHQVSVSSLQNALRNMKTQDVLPLYINKQNAGVIFRKMSSELITFESFELSLPNEMIANTPGKVVVEYPANPRLRLEPKSDLFSTLASALAFFKSKHIADTIPVSFKSGKKHEEVRDVASPRYITEALAGFLRAIEPVDVTRVETLFITKRIGDHILWNSAFKPWRRSSIWLLLRITLQSTLAELKVCTAEGYKTFQVFFMARLLNMATVAGPDIIDTDLLNTMMQKLARRMWKLQELVDNHINPPLTEVVNTISRTAEIMGAQWKKTMDACVNRIHWSMPTAEDIKESTHFTFPNSQPYLKELLGRTTLLNTISASFDDEATDLQLIDSCSSRFCPKSPSLPEVINTQELEIGLYDIECWVETQLPTWMKSPTRASIDCKPLASIIEAYMEHAILAYQSSPERISVMWLTVLELWIALDRLVISWCPLLGNYSPDIPSELFEPLLLPFSEQMRRLQQAERYLQGRWNVAVQNGGISAIYGDINSHASFQNRFFPSSVELCQLKCRIEQREAKEREDKRDELEALNAEYRNKIDETNRLSCDYVSNYKCGEYFPRRHSNYCRRCRLIQESNSMKIQKFEDYLPKQQQFLQPLVFELDCPLPFGIWRDATYQFRRRAMKQEQPKPPGSNIRQISDYYPTNLFLTPKDFRISVASIAKSIHHDHRRSCNIPSSIDEVIFPHAGQHSIFDKETKSFLKEERNGAEAIRERCTFQLDHPYGQSMQHFVSNTNHSPNLVIASQSCCPIELGISEYVVFGQLRSGNAIQWRNIARALCSYSLSFTDPSIYSLLAQASWQVGPDVPVDSCREAHQDLRDEVFVRQLLGVVQQHLDKLGDSGTKVWHLACLILVASRTLSLSLDEIIVETVLGMLSQARNTALLWIQNLEFAKPEGMGPSKDYQQRLSTLAMICRSTFDVEPSYLANLCRKDNIRIMIEMLVLIASNPFTPRTSAAQTLVIRDHVLSYRLEPFITAASEISPVLDDIAIKSWPSHVKGNSWSQLPSKGGRWWKTTTSSSSHQTVHVNIIDGTLLVNGKTANKLPPEYLSHSSYQDVFGHNFSLKALPSSMAGMDYQAQFKDFMVHFKKAGDDLVIRIRHGETIHEYIPKSKLDSDIPASFLVKCNMWYQEVGYEGLINFRPKSDSLNFVKSPWQMSLGHDSGLVTGHLRKSKSGETIQVAMNPHSRTFMAIHDVLHVLEPEITRMSVFISPSEAYQSIQVDLPRHRLQFQVNDGGILECVNLPGYQVADSQDAGCLYGLSDYLVLSDNSGAQSQRKVLIPKGQISISNSQNYHPHIRIDCSAQGGFYAFAVDDLVGRLHGLSTVESDLHLIELHACTSSAFPDPLTGRTGREEAMDRLHTASLFSYQALPETWREQVTRISEISARREFYPPHLSQMESVTWNSLLPSSSQSSSFHFAIDRLLRHWKDITHFDTGDSDCTSVGDDANIAHLNRRALLRETGEESCHSHDIIFVRSWNMTSNDSQEREMVAYNVTLSTMGREYLPMCEDLEAVVKTWPLVKATQNWEFEDLASWFSRDISNTWSTFYSLSSTGHPGPSMSASLAFCLTSYCEPALQPIMELLGRIQCRGVFRQPRFAHGLQLDLCMDKGYTFKDDQFIDGLRETAVGFDSSPEASLVQTARGRTPEERLQARKTEYNSAVESEARAVVQDIRRYWPNYPSRGSIRINPQRHLTGLDEHVKMNIFPIIATWTQNFFFVQHIRGIVQQLNQMRKIPTLPSPHDWSLRSSHTPSSSPPFIRLADLISIRKAPTDIFSCDGALPFESFMPYGNGADRMTDESVDLLLEKMQEGSKSNIEEHYLSHLGESMAALKMSTSSSTARMAPLEILRLTSSFQMHILQLLNQNIKKGLAPNSCSQRLLFLSGLWPRSTSKVLLRKLSFRERRETSGHWISTISHLANQIINVQHIRRMLQFAILGKEEEYSQEVLLGRKNRMQDELDWLLLEIDGDFCIRSRQVDIANAMINPPDVRNSAIQLDMGEGKSSVIVPMAAGKLADSKRLVRVVVLKAQARLQLQLLRQRLSGLANRRIYSLPLSRDLKVNDGGAVVLERLLKGWLEEGAVWLCQPEHILSFQLLGIDTLMRQSTNPSTAHRLIDCHIWTLKNTRDILDESDEILHPRNQLIYTVRRQQELDAAPSRWEIVQQLLAQLKNRLSQVPTNRDFLVTHMEPPAEPRFPVIRIVDHNAQDFLVDLAKAIVFEDTLVNVRLRNLPQSLKETALRFIANLGVARQDAIAIEDYCKQQGSDDPMLWKSLLLLRGLIAHKILFTVLKEKRWKVDYGLDLRRSQLAVPYRAMNSPSLRSNYAHPDVLIITTCLSYYYGGMDDGMISRAIEQLFKTDNPDLIYSEWLSEVPTVPGAMRDLRSLALEDADTMVRILQPNLRYNKRAIDFFLNNCVFSKEAKAFPEKLSSSGWDLAAAKDHLTTGFSGTNDSRFLLPTPIVQVDTPEQRHTNAMVIKRLLRPENATVVPHHDRISSTELLKLIMAQSPMPKVLLDVGAQVLDCSNGEFVEKWLALFKDNDTIKAGVYFDDDDTLRVMSKDRSTQAFSESSFVNLLGECVVFLDDAHTRGTDLKLPPCQAAVTLGPRLTKDKLVQGCMRMRKLGSSHSLVFFCPKEVVVSIKRTIGIDRSVTVPDILMWTMKETCRQLTNSASLWVIQGHEFAKRKIGWDSLHDQKATSEHIKETMLQPDSRTLNEHYGVGQTQTPYSWISAYHQADAVNPISRQIFQESKLFGNITFQEAKAQEEQEIELIQEEEVERDAEGPPPMTPHEHRIHPDVQSFVMTGRIEPHSSAFLAVPDSLRNTTMKLPKGSYSVFKAILVTSDFAQTIVPSIAEDTMDQFLRPVEWLVSSRENSNGTLVAFSPYEVNELMPLFRQSNSKVTLNIFSPYTTELMTPLDDLRLFKLPPIAGDPPLPRSLVIPLNLFSGSLYLPSQTDYRLLCNSLRLYFGSVEALPEVNGTCPVNSCGFVSDKEAQKLWGLMGDGFEESPIEFLRQLIHLRRNGRSFFPSDMGQILYGIGLEGRNWEEKARKLLD